MKQVLAFSIFLLALVVFIPLAHAFTTVSENQGSMFSDDSKIKKYEKQIEKIRAQILKLEEKITAISKLKQKRLDQLSPTARSKNDTGEVTSDDTITAKELREHPSAGKTWRTQFFPNGTPPLNAFKVFYFNTTQPTKTIATAQVDAIDINYAWSEGPGFTIVSEDFGGYWIGDFVLSKDEEMTLNVSQSWAETRVILDGHLIYKGSDNISVNIQVPKGRHTLEIEHINNWHTVGFSASLRITSYVPKAITASEVNKINHKEVWYAGVSESGATNNIVRLISKTSNKKPKILFLSSYAPVKWDASSLKNTGIIGIIYNSYEPGAEVINVPQDIPVYVGNVPYGYILKAQCPTNDHVGGLTSCEGIDYFTDVYHAIKALTTKPLTGFSGTYSTTELHLPGIVLTETLIKDALAHPVKLRSESAKFIEGQKIDKIF